MGEARGAARPELRELRFAGPAAREPRGSSHDPFVPSIVSAKLCWVGTPYANYISLSLSLFILPRVFAHLPLPAGYFHQQASLKLASFLLAPWKHRK